MSSTPLRSDGKPWRFSATQLSTYRDCPAKYAFKYVDGLPDPTPRPWLAFGIKVHKHVEEHLKHGTPIPGDTAEGRSAIALVACLPGDIPHAAYTIEGETELHEGGFTWVIKRDLAALGPGSAPFVGDFKTTSYVSRWAMTEDLLRTDTQAMLYARAAFAENRAAVNEGRLRWMSVERRGLHPKTRVADITVTRAHVAEQFEGLLVATRGAADIISNRRPGRSLPMVRESCDKYGGCPYRSVCPEGSRLSLFGGFDMSQQSPVSQFLSNMAPTAPAPAAASPPAIPPGTRGVDAFGMFPPGTWVQMDTGHQGVVQDDGRVWINCAMPGQPAAYSPQSAPPSAYTVIAPPPYAAQHLEAMKNPPPPPPPPPPPAPPANPYLGGAPTGAVNPQEHAPNATPAASAQTYVNVTRQEKNAAPDTSELAPAIAAEVHAAAANTSPPPAEEKAPPKPRGRAKKTPDVVSVDDKGVVSGAGFTPPTAHAEPTPAPFGAPSGSLVLVDCYIASRGAAVAYNEVFEVARQRFEQETKLAHPMLVDFGKGLGALYQIFSAMEFPPAVIVDSSEYGASVFIGIATTRGATVIRGRGR